MVRSNSSWGLKIGGKIILAEYTELILYLDDWTLPNQTFEISDLLYPMIRHHDQAPKTLSCEDL